VCGMTVTEQSEHKLTHEGRPYYFCSAKCQGKFAANPLQYLVSTAPEDTAPEPAGTIYTCPMHPRCGRIILDLSQVRHDIGAHHSPGRGRQP
jgi:YHS domain-containing protein